MGGTLQGNNDEYDEEDDDDGSDDDDFDDFGVTTGIPETSQPGSIRDKNHY